MNKSITSFEERVERRWTTSRATWRSIDLGTLDSIPLGEGRAFTINGLSIAVFRQRDGQLFAVDGTCPHRNGPLADGIVGNGKLICPLHAWIFNLETGRCTKEDVALRTYSVRESDGHILLDLSPACHNTHPIQ